MTQIYGSKMKKCNGSVVEKWSRKRKVLFSNQGKAVILITCYPGQDLNPSVPWLLTYMQHTCFHSN